MSKLSLKETINKKFNWAFISALIILLIIFGLVFYTFYNIDYKNEKEKMKNSIKNFMGNLIGDMSEIEKKYNEEMEKQLIKFFKNYEKINNDSNLQKQVKDIKQNIKSIQKENIKLNKINYYLINSQGKIYKTDYQSDLGLDLSKFTGIWEKLKRLDPGEVLLLPLDPESKTNRLRLYSYVKLPDGNIFELGILFENYDKSIKSNLEKLGHRYRADAYLFSYGFRSLFKEDVELTETEKSTFKKSLKEKRLIEKSNSLFETSYYIGWETDYGPKYIKLKIMYSHFRNILFILGLSFLAIILILYLVKRSLNNLIEDDFIEPITQLSGQMNSFDPEEATEIEIEENEIKEIDQIRKSYLGMVDEIQASYQQLKSYSQEITSLNEDLKESIEEVNMLNDRFINMVEVVSNLTTHFYQESKFLSKLLEAAANIIPEVDYGKVCLFENGKCRFVDAIGHDISLLKKLDIDEDLFLDCKYEGICHLGNCQLIKLEDVSKEDRAVLEAALEPNKEIACVDIVVNSNIVGKITLSIAKGSDKSFNDKIKKFLKLFANLASAFFYWQRYNRVQGEFIREFVTSLTNILEIHDVYTRGHSKNVAQWGVEIARELGLSDEKISDTYWAGMVHDIGKLLIPLEILNKDGALSEREYERVKKHPRWGYLSLKQSEFSENIGKYLLHHHERWDGEGYPEGLEGEEIPLVSQILAVADAWDAMTSSRAYREALEKEKAIQEIKDNKGTQFSPKVADAFLRLLEKGVVIKS